LLKLRHEICETPNIGSRSSKGFQLSESWSAPSVESEMHYQTLVTQGRKAGLQTREMYQALSTRKPQAGDRPAGAADGDGYITLYGPNGQIIYRPNPPHRAL